MPGYEFHFFMTTLKFFEINMGKLFPVPVGKKLSRGSHSHIAYFEAVIAGSHGTYTKMVPTRNLNSCVGLAVLSGVLKFCRWGPRGPQRAHLDR